MFAGGVILVEGGTEFGLLPIWMERSARHAGRSSPDDENIAFFDVGGQEGFGSIVELLHRLRVPWVAFADGQVFDPVRPKHIFKQIAGAVGSATPSLTAALEVLDNQPDFPHLKQAGERVGVFTLASTWEAPEEGIETYLRKTNAAALDAACRAEGRSKPRRGRHFAEAVPCPANWTPFSQPCSINSLVPAPTGLTHRPPTMYESYERYTHVYGIRRPRSDLVSSSRSGRRGQLTGQGQSDHVGPCVIRLLLAGGTPSSQASNPCPNRVLHCIFSRSSRRNCIKTQSSIRMGKRSR